MGVMLGLVTWTIRISSASRTGRLSLKDVRLMDINSNDGSLGLAAIMAAAAAADAVPMSAELHMNLALLPMNYGRSLLIAFSMSCRSDGG